eukprot:10293941-Alexandrium_andersonii.AAC.1
MQRQHCAGRPVNKVPQLTIATHSECMTGDVGASTRVPNELNGRKAYEFGLRTATARGTRLCESDTPGEARPERQQLQPRTANQRANRCAHLNKQ